MVEPSLVEEFGKQRRNDLGLDSVIVDFPRTRAIEHRDAGYSETERYMHREAVAAYQASVVLDIANVLEE